MSSSDRLRAIREHPETAGVVQRGLDRFTAGDDLAAIILEAYAAGIEHERWENEGRTPVRPLPVESVPAGVGWKARR